MSSPNLGSKSTFGVSDHTSNGGPTTRTPNRVSVSGFRVSGFGSRVPGFGGIQNFGFRVSGFEFRGSGSQFRVQSFGFRVSGSEFRASFFGDRQNRDVMFRTGKGGLGLDERPEEQLPHRRPLNLTRSQKLL